MARGGGVVRFEQGRRAVLRWGAKNKHTHSRSDNNGTALGVRYPPFCSLGTEAGRGINSITVGVLSIVRSEDYTRLTALAELTGKDYFNDYVLLGLSK